MGEDSKEKQDVVYSVETVPPPPGEDDAYSAPTKVGDVHPAVLEAMKKAGVSFPAKPAPGAAPAAKEETSEQSGEADDAIPRVFEEGNEDELPTKLSTHATPPRPPATASAAPAAEPAPAAAPTPIPEKPAVAPPLPAAAMRSAPPPFSSAPPERAIAPAPDQDAWTPRTLVFGAAAVLLLLAGVVAFVAAIVLKGC